MRITMQARRAIRRARLVAALFVAAALGSCGGGSDGGGSTVIGGGNNTCGGGGGYGSGDPTACTGYVARMLVSNQSGAANVDPNLVNGWGVAFNPQGFVWVSAAGTSTSTLYDGNGVPQSLVVAIPPGQAGPAAPTGIVFNGSTDFRLAAGGTTHASPFIFAGLAGTVAAWSPNVDLDNAVTVFDGAATNALYTGLALANRGGANVLYAADFRNGVVDGFDANFAKFAAGFTDASLPAGYSPFGVQTIGGNVYVAYAQRNANGRNAVKGAGLGIVNVFDASGTLLRRVATGGPLNAPWGMAVAPANFGDFGNALLVGNFGDGHINAFDAATGAALGALVDSGGTPITIDGLWGIAFGNGINAQPANTLFYAAGPADETQGRYGRIDSRSRPKETEVTDPAVTPSPRACQAA